MSGRPKRAPKRSRKYDDEELGEEELSAEEEVPLDDDDSEEVEEPKPKKKRAPPRPKKPTGAFTDSKGWSFQPPSLLYKSYEDPAPNAKIAAFDLDGTLVNVKSGAQFPKDESDYKWFNKHAVEKVQSYHDSGYKVVIFTNQGGIKSAVTGKAAEKVKGRVDAIVGELGIPVQVLAATLEDNYRKPQTGMWEFFCQHLNGGVQPDVSKSFYVGDAAGRPGDFADSDQGFAAAIGLTFRLPEEEFGEMEGKKALPAAKKSKGDDGALEVVNPDNKGLVDVFTQLADRAFEEAKIDAKAKFKGISARKVAGVLASFGDKVTLSNLKEVGKLQGVGKGSIAKIQEYLQTGTVAELAGVDDLAGVGRAPPQMKDTGKDIANKFM